ncbi:PREDICTED: uncharacterized protein LOC104744729 [Camelina sativa]|uniref:Uncharacterized protein LOC104744729 n=1 Tax=Camelina sativa TaxID=90675 RepID=A0ABM1QZG4_CAMSA|nr:PREDICTED: uncharacterized protein LOC104744729 [Camelina sativa]
MESLREEESQARDGGNNNHHNRIADDQGPRLNLPLTKTPELINLIQNYLNRNNPCSPQQSESSKTSMLPPKVPAERLKAMNFPISMIIIGQWEYRATNPDDIVAKLYFAKKKLIWEILDARDPKTNMPRLKTKIEIEWDDVASFQESINSRDETGILKIELKKRPKFFIENNPIAGKHTQWKQMDQDFTEDQAASRFSIHTLHFDAGVLQKNLEKLLSDSFWAKLYDVNFPVREAVFFDIDYGINNNTNSPSYVLSQTRHFNVNSDLIHHPSQGIGHVGVGEGNSNVYWDNNGSQNSYGQANNWVYTGN